MATIPRGALAAFTLAGCVFFHADADGGGGVGATGAAGGAGAGGAGAGGAGASGTGAGGEAGAAGGGGSQAECPEEATHLLGEGNKAIAVSGAAVLSGSRRIVAAGPYDAAFDFAPGFVVDDVDTDDHGFFFGVREGTSQSEGVSVRSLASDERLELRRLVTTADRAVVVLDTAGTLANGGDPLFTTTVSSVVLSVDEGGAPQWSLALEPNLGVNGQGEIVAALPGPMGSTIVVGWFQEDARLVEGNSAPHELGPDAGIEDRIFVARVDELGFVGDIATWETSADRVQDAVVVGQALYLIGAYGSSPPEFINPNPLPFAVQPAAYLARLQLSDFSVTNVFQLASGPGGIVPRRMVGVGTRVLVAGEMDASTANPNTLVFGDASAAIDPDIPTLFVGEVDLDGTNAWVNTFSFTEPDVLGSVDLVVRGAERVATVWFESPAGLVIGGEVVEPPAVGSVWLGFGPMGNAGGSKRWSSTANAEMFVGLSASLGCGDLLFGAVTGDTDFGPDVGTDPRGLVAVRPEGVPLDPP